MNELVTTLILASVLSASAQEIYVSPFGDDAGSGTLLAPFRSLLRGHTAARKLLEHDMANRVTVYLLEGTYPLTETFVLDQRDVRSSYAAYKDARVVITAAHKVAGWQKLGETETQRKVLLENSPEFFDERGEWFHDMEQHRLYYWPSDGGAPRLIVPCVRSTVDKGETLSLKILTLSAKPCKSVTIHQ